MKYKAKYLPVKGKVEIGDYFIDTGVMNKIGKRANKDGVYDFQKVKLFLISTDIIVGDELTHITSGRKGKYCSSTSAGGYGFIFIDGTDYGMDRHHIDNWVKVIGEISPEATWIKEGDKFTEDDVQGFYGGGGDVIHEGKFAGKRRSVTFNWRLDTDEETLEEFKVKTDDRYRIIYKIKGPCGHYH